MSRQHDLDLADISAIKALDWLTGPMTATEYMEALEVGRHWNDFVRAKQEPQKRNKQPTARRPLILKFDEQETLERQRIQARITELRQWKQQHPNNQGDDKPGENW